MNIFFIIKNAHNEIIQGTKNVHVLSSYSPANLWLYYITNPNCYIYKKVLAILEADITVPDREHSATISATIASYADGDGKIQHIIIDYSLPDSLTGCILVHCDPDAELFSHAELIDLTDLRAHNREISKISDGDCFKILTLKRLVFKDLTTSIFRC